MTRKVIVRGRDERTMYNNVRIVLDVPERTEGVTDRLPAVYVERGHGHDAMGEPIWQDISDSPDGMRVILAVLLELVLNPPTTMKAAEGMAALYSGIFTKSF